MEHNQGEGERESVAKWNATCVRKEWVTACIPVAKVSPKISKGKPKKEIRLYPKFILDILKGKQGSLLVSQPLQIGLAPLFDHDGWSAHETVDIIGRGV
jgi:hypothetical protein